MEDESSTRRLIVCLIHSGLEDANIDSRQPWLTSLYVPIGSRLIPLPVLSFLLPSNSTLAQHKRRDSHGRRPTPFSFGVIAYVAVTVVLVVAPFVAVAILWTVFKARRSTLVVTRTELQRIWRYEIASGHYPSTRRPDLSISSTQAELNPGIESGIHAAGSIFGIGQKRTYRTLPLNKLSSTDLRTMPPRPARGSALDLDVVLNHCDFSTGKYVRDCLEFLRINGGLQGSQVRRGKLHAWRATYFTDGASSSQSQPHGHDAAHSIFGSSSEHVDAHILERRQRTLSSRASQSLAPITPHPSNPTADPICDPDYPRIFHIWWSGPFTDKPYAAALSFLYTQNVRLDRPIDSPPPADTCRPQLWIWINPGPASSLPVEGAGEALRRELAQNMWSAPLLHSRFEDVLKFQLWNTSEQLDGVEEMHGWRSRPLFQSHGKKYATPQKGAISSSKLFSRVGSSTSRDYDRLSVVLSDMARFVLTHRFGGVYLDADTLLLRDWEELFGWHGAFAYRWSRLPLYNTAVLKMQRGSSLGSWIFKTAVANNMDFHPMTLARYTRDAKLDGLLLRLPDALFDPPWLNIEDYQRDRPAFPTFKSFDDFFETPKGEAAAPVAVGFDGFFRGAFSYHWHNAWWRPFDPARNYPDLGSRFPHTHPNASRAFIEPSRVNVTDLSWSAVMKRTFEAYLRGDAPNMYGEWITYEQLL